VLIPQLRFRDDQFPTLALYCTEVGEALPDTSQPGLTNQQLLQLVRTHGDSRANLKFLVQQMSIPDASSATVVPPTDTAFRARPGVPPILTNIEPAPPYTPHPASSTRHSKDGSHGSLASAGEPMDRGHGSRTSITDRSAPPQDNGNSYMPHHMSSGSDSVAYGGVEPQVRTMSPPSLNPELPPSDEGTYRASSSNAMAGPSTHASSSREVLSGGYQNLDLSGIDPESAKLILELQQQDEAEEQRRIQEDELIALQAQETEREVWQVIQELHFERQREMRARMEAERVSPGGTQRGPHC